MDKDKLKQARALLAGVTPMNRDCGRICGAACCQPDEDGKGGVFLFPGEAELIGGGWAQLSRVESGPGDGLMLTCGGTCDRNRRPLGCMIFPLTPEVDGEGHVSMRFDARARPVCPLLRNGLMGLRTDFREAAQQAMRIIASDPEGLQFLREWEALERQYDFKL
ncbi:MAG: hypothetical protein IJ048_11680 [Clostridia bacterium]|nr:hypothetical protein [Clostridia bacterium]